MPQLKLLQIVTGFWGGSFVVLAADQLVKHEIRLRQLADGGFSVCNSGIAFGITLPDGFFWLVLGIIIILGVFGVVRVFQKGLFSPVFLGGLVLATGGGLSNLSDRFLWGCVLDHISLWTPLFPVFNLADIFIFSGSCLVCYSLIVQKRA